MHLFRETKVVAAHDDALGVLTKLNSNPYGLVIDSTETPRFVEGQGGKIGKTDGATEKVTGLRLAIASTWKCSESGLAQSFYPLIKST
jgi:hypothetical protein